VQGRPVGELDLRCSVSGWGKIRAGAVGVYRSAGDALELAQRSGAVEDHGGAHVPAQVAPARPHWPCRPAARFHQSDAVSFWGRENLEWDQRPIECSLAQLGVLTVGEVSFQAAERAWVKAALFPVSLFGFCARLARTCNTFVRDGQGRSLACLVFGAAAWKCQDRDRFIGCRPHSGNAIWASSSQ